MTGMVMNLRFRRIVLSCSSIQAGEETECSVCIKVASF